MAAAAPATAPATEPGPAPAHRPDGRAVRPPAVRDTQRGRDRDAAVLTVLCWAFVVLPRLAQSLTAPKHRTVLGEDPIPYSALAGASDRLLTLAVLGWCAVVVVRRLHALPTRRFLALTALLAPWTFQVVRDHYEGHLPETTALLYPAVVVAVWVLRPSLAALRVLGVLVGVTAVTSLALGWLVPAKGVYADQTGAFIAPDKQILPWGILVGPFSDGNNLAQFLVVGLPAALLLRSTRSRLAVLAAVGLALTWTASRSSLGALAAGLALALVLPHLSARAARRVAVAGVCGAAGVLAVLPLLPRDDGSFTNRGYIWRRSLEALAERPLLGHGSRWYAELGQYADGLGGYARHGHNQVVHALATGGLLLALLGALMGLVLVAAAGAHAARGSAHPAVLLVVFCLSCSLEVSFGFVDRDFLLPVTVLPMAWLAFATTTAPSAPSGQAIGQDEGRAGTAGLGELLAAVRAGWGVVVVVALTAVALAGAASVLAPVAHRATATVLLTVDAPAPPPEVSRGRELEGGSTYAQEQARTLAELGERTDLLSEAARGAGLDVDTARLRSAVEVRVPLDTSVLHVTASLPDPASARVLADAVARELSTLTASLEPEVAGVDAVDLVQVAPAGEARRTGGYTGLNLLVAGALGVLLGSLLVLHRDAGRRGAR